MHREREKDREKERSRARDKEKSRDRDHEKDRERDKDRHRERERPRESRKPERDRENESEGEYRERREKDRREKYKDERERDGERARDREKDRDDPRERDRLKERRKRESERPRDRRDGDRDRDWREVDDERERKRRKRDEDFGRSGETQEREREKHRERDKRRKEDEPARVEAKGKKEIEEIDFDEEQRKLDEEVEKRRRRVQEWQELRRRKEEDERKRRADAGEGTEEQPNSGKAWTLEGEESDDEDMPKADDATKPKDSDVLKVSILENGDAIMVDHQEGAGEDNKKDEETQQIVATVGLEKKGEDEELDPLDAFMNSMVLPEVEKLTTEDALRIEAATPTTTGLIKEREPTAHLNGSKSSKRFAKNVTGRMLPGDDSESEEEKDEVEEENAEEDDDEFMKRVKKSKAEKLALVDHSKIDYMPFRKNFYIEVKELTRMTPEEVSAFRKEFELKVRGKDAARPVKTWNQTGLGSKALEVIKKFGFEKPMPIQAQALPIIMSGRDCIGIAKTGSGKTLAFVLPMLRHIKDQPPLSPGDGPIGLIMAPTRELVQQIFNDIKKFAKAMGLSAVPVYGGSGVAQQISDLKRGTEIVVCTPGRMIDILCTSAGKITNLRRVTYLVLDEADRMFDMGFEPQITRIVQNTRPDRQTVLFSATFPRQVEVVARKVLNRPVEIQVGGRSVVNKDIAQTVEVRPDGQRFLRLLELLGEWFEKGKILIFVHSQDKCDSLFKDLMNAGYPCLSLHGAKDQTDRESTISDFKSNVGNLLIATSVAARGLDVKELELVVNYDVPNHYEDYVHRVGRTGRAGKKGCAITFISEDEARYAPDLVKAFELSEQPVPEDLKKLAVDFMAKVNQGTEQSHGSGYGGSGFKFNEEEDEAKKAAKKAQAKEYGFEEDEDKSGSDSDDDGIRKAGGDLAQVAAAAAMVAAKAGLTIPGPISVGQPSLGATAPQYFSMAQAAGVSGAGMALPGVPSGMGLLPVSAGIPNIATIAGSTGLPTIPGLGFPGLGVGAGVPPVPNEAAARAAAFAAAVNFQHNLAKIQADALPEHYEAELEINDFPQHARWKATHKDSLGPISEWTGAAITTRGQFFPPGKVPAPGERKLYLFIEGPTETSVKKAKTDIKRILEECAAASLSLPGGGQPGKYSVL